LLFGIAAYGIWALFPFYFRAVDYVAPIEIIANRIIWSFVLLMIIMTVTRQWGTLRIAASNRKALGLVALGAIFVAANWSTYVIAISTNHALQASLGYFINPLVIVGLGVFVLKERLRPMQWLAVAIAALAVLVLTVSYGSLPWIALILAFSWAIYGFIKRYVGWGAIESIAVETAVLTPVALAVMLVLFLNGTAVFFADGISTSLLLMLAGPITTIPLLFFTGAATRVPFSTLGLLQYITTIGLFIVGVVFFGEEMSQMRWVGFAMIWVALIVFTIDARRHMRTTSLRDAQLLPEE
jgi:chloramphenicol-sensitive protein RarD